MSEYVQRLWAKQDRHTGDRWRLFSGVAEVIEAADVLYPGSFDDISPSFVLPSVTYVDTDARAARFFAEENALREIVALHDGAPADPKARFIPGDYTTDLPLSPPRPLSGHPMVDPRGCGAGDAAIGLLSGSHATNNGDLADDDH